MNRALSVNDFEQSTILIKLNKSYKPGDSDQLLYEYTRAYWHMSMKKAERVRYVMPLYKGAILEVYEPEGWYKALTTKMEVRNDIESDDEVAGRIEFVGKVTSETIRNKYVGNDAVSNLPWGQGPFIYIGC